MVPTSLHAPIACVEASSLLSRHSELVVLATPEIIHAETPLFRGKLNRKNEKQSENNERKTTCAADSSRVLQGVCAVPSVSGRKKGAYARRAEQRNAAQNKEASMQASETNKRFDGVRYASVRAVRGSWRSDLAYIRGCPLGGVAHHPCLDSTQRAW